MQVIFVIAFAFMLVFDMACAGAADIAVQDLPQTGGAKLITVMGELQSGDEKQFTNFAVQAKGAVVVFNSPGGSVPAAIQIGKAIRLKGFATLVPDGSICTSACALAWLGGTSRYMTLSAKVGFHAAYINNSGEKQVSSVANALIGSYLNGLGYSEDAIAFFTSAPPEDLQWLTFEESARLGIEVRSFDELRKEAAKAPASIKKSGQNPMPKVIKAKAFVRALIIAGESNNPDDLLKYYGQKILYSGKVKDKSEVSAEYDVYIRRWPYRRFAVPDDDMSVTCDDVLRRCAVSLNLRWLAESPERHQRSEGTARRSFILQENGDGFWVLALEESILSRNVTALGPRPLQNSTLH